MPSDPKAPSTLPPPSTFLRTSESEMLIAAQARATTAMRPLPPLKGRPRVIVEEEAIGWTDLSAGARALVGRLDGKTTVLDLADGTDAEVDALFDVLAELEKAGIIAYET